MSGRTVARSGLRMMPTFPLSPLSFRTAGFPQYGWKVGLSGSAFPHVAQVKPAPGMRGVGSSTPEVLAPVWVIVSQSIYAYSTSSVPLAGTSRFHRMATYTGCLRCAGAPRRPTIGSVLSLFVPYRHAALYDPGESIGCFCSVLRQRH